MGERAWTEGIDLANRLLKLLRSQGAESWGPGDEDVVQHEDNDVRNARKMYEIFVSNEQNEYQEHNANLSPIANRSNDNEINNNPHLRSRQ